MRNILALFIVALWFDQATALEPPRYNVLLIMADDLRPAMGCYGDQ